MRVNPFDKNKFVGYVSKVTPEITRIHFPNSKLLKKFYYDGDVLQSGLVRSYVIIEGEGHGFLARVMSIELPEKERMFLSESSFQGTDLHPVGTVEIQICFDIFGEIKAEKGLEQYPPVGAKVYACPTSFLHGFLKDFGKNEEVKSDDLLELGYLPQQPLDKIKFSSNAIFSRHCAVVGTTGSGKSYTIAKMVECLTEKDNAKIILIDATGEFSKLGEKHKTASVSPVGDCFHYSNLHTQDLYSIFRPAGQVQVPKLQESIKSLKIVNLATAAHLARIGTDGPVIDNGLLKKSGHQRSPFLNYYYANAANINDSVINFDLQRLPLQIIEECAWENDTSWGTVNENAKSNCSSLVLRIQQRIEDDSFGKIFNFKNEEREDLASKIVDFLDSESNDKLLHIDLSGVPKEKDLVEILTNAIGRKLFNLSKSGILKDRPLIVFLDEAHIFLNKKIKDEYSLEVELDAFDRIAKECRKYGLFLCLSTQRPRDIPQGVLSQMGTFITHRLINFFDREAIENATTEGSKNLLSFLPSLSKGEAIVMGVEFPMPVHFNVEKIKDEHKPNSDTPVLFKSLET